MHMGRTTHGIYHERERREDNPTDPLIRVVARQSQHLIQACPVIKPCTDKHLHERGRDTREGDFEQEHCESLCRIHGSVAFFATQFLGQRIACEQSEYTGRGARFEGDLVIKRGATENTTKRDCEECGASRVSNEGNEMPITNLNRTHRSQGCPNSPHSARAPGSQQAPGMIRLPCRSIWLRIVT